VNWRISREWLNEVCSRLTSELPSVVAAVVTGDDMDELLHVSMGHHSRRRLRDLSLYDKIYSVAKYKYGDVLAVELTSETTYNLLVGLEWELEQTYKLRLHLSTHYLQCEKEYIYITEFLVPIKTHDFNECPLCTTLRNENGDTFAEHIESTDEMD